MTIVSQAQSEMQMWSEGVFGEQRYVLHGKEELSGEEREREVKEKQEELETLLAKEYLSDAENERIFELNTEIVGQREGEFGEHVGYAPLFKRSEINIKESPESNLARSGKGEMGAIMLDFEWNSRVAQNGYVELGKPVYDKKLWLEGAWNIEPPTVRGVVDIGMTIVSKAVNAAVTGVVGGADFGVLGSLAGSAVGLLDDLLFAGADVSGGYKSASEVGDELAKKSIAAAVNVGLGTLGAGIGSAVEGLGGVVGVLSEIGIAGGSSAITTVTDTALGAMDFTNVGNADFFNTEMFTSQMGSVSTWGSTVSSMVTAGVSGGMGLVNLRDGNNTSLTQNVFDVENMGTFNSFVGGIAGSAVTYAMTDSVTFNLANYKGVGLFELTVSKDGGFSSRLGMGGMAKCIKLRKKATRQGRRD